MATYQEQHREKRKKIVELYQSGLSLRQVGAQVGLKAGAVRSCLKTEGVPTRTYHEGQQQRFPGGRTGPLASFWKGGRKMTAHKREFAEGERVHDGNGHLKSRKGDQAGHWKGGRYVGNHAAADHEAQSYVYVYAPDHPFATKQGYVMEHRLVAEQKIGRPLAKNEIVHHVNGDRLDNRPENLEVMTRREHTRLHFAMAPLVDQLQRRVAQLEQELSHYRARFSPLPPCA